MSPQKLHRITNTLFTIFIL